MSWTTYPIGRPQRVCAATGAPLSPGDHTIATLVENPATNQIERRDFSLNAWNAVPRPVAPRHVLAWWKVVLTATDQRPRPILDDDAMLDLFEQLGTDHTVIEPDTLQNGPGHEPQAAPTSSRSALRLVLALMMIRRRILSHEANRGTSLLVRPKGVARPQAGGPPLIEVQDPGLDEATISEVLSELESLGIADEETPPLTPPSTP